MSFTEDLHRREKCRRWLCCCRFLLFVGEGDRIVNDLTRWLMPVHVRRASSLYTFTLNRREEEKRNERERTDGHCSWLTPSIVLPSVSPSFSSNQLARCPFLRLGLSPTHFLFFLYRSSGRCVKIDIDGRNDGGARRRSDGKEKQETSLLFLHREIRETKEMQSKAEDKYLFENRH